MPENRKTEQGDKGSGFDLGLGGLLGGLGGLGDLVGKLSELAEKGEELSKSSEFNVGDPEKGVKGIYGFSVKVGLGGEGVKVEPFGNVRKDESTGESVVHEVREPLVDVLQEEDHTLVVVEMPGIGLKDVKLEVVDDLLTIEASKGEQKYRKEVLLPESFEREKMETSCNNGVLEIRCKK